MTAAKSASMRCVAIPDPLLAADPRYRADLVLPSLALLDELALRALGAREVRPLPGLCDESLAVTGKAAEDPAGDAVARGRAR